MRGIVVDDVITLAGNVKRAGNLNRQEAWAVAREILRTTTGNLKAPGFQVSWWQDYGKRYFSITRTPMRAETRRIIGAQ